jgi:hypothetical protein
MTTQTREHLENIIDTKGIGSHLALCYKFAIEKKNVEAVRYIRNYLESSTQGKWSWEGEDASKILDKYEKQAIELLKPKTNKMDYSNAIKEEFYIINNELKVKGDTIKRTEKAKLMAQKDVLYRLAEKVGNFTKDELFQLYFNSGTTPPQS